VSEIITADATRAVQPQAKTLKEFQILTMARDLLGANPGRIEK
jgi:hypothetical protein